MKTEVKNIHGVMRNDENEDGEIKIGECVTMCGICTKYFLCLHRNVMMNNI